MNKHFLKLGLFVASAVSIALFSACEKEDGGGAGNGGNGGGGDASIVTITDFLCSVYHSNGDHEYSKRDLSGRAKTVKALVVYEVEPDNEWDDSWKTDTIAETEFSNNGITLQLPKIMADKYLRSVTVFENEGITISDRDAKLATSLYIEAFFENSTDIAMAGFYYGETDGDYEVQRWYADRDVTVTGEYSGVDKYTGSSKVQVTYNLNLKKGWNVVYAYEHEYGEANDWKGIHTSTKPAGINFSWVCYPISTGVDFSTYPLR